MKRIRAVILIVCMVLISISIHTCKASIESENTQSVPTLKSVEETTTEFRQEKQITKQKKVKKIKFKKGYIKENNINIRKKPRIKSSKKGLLLYGSKIKYRKVNKEWSEIKYNNKKGYIKTKYITKKKIKSTTHNAPSYNLLSFMDYRCITNTSSKQYVLQRKSYTGNYGIRQMDGRYCIAVGSYYTTKVGKYIDLILANGTIIPCVLADCKADKHTDNRNQKTSDGSLIEFVVDTPNLVSTARRMGDIKYSCNKWYSRVVKIKIYK